MRGENIQVSLQKTKTNKRMYCFYVIMYKLFTNCAQSTLLLH